MIFRLVMFGTFCPGEVDLHRLCPVVKQWRFFEGDILGGFRMSKRVKRGDLSIMEDPGSL